MISVHACVHKLYTCVLLQRDKQLIRDLLAEIEKYSSRNQLKKEEKAEAERRRQHEAQHAALQKSIPEEKSGFTAGGNQQQNNIPPQPSVDEEEEEKEVDPSIVGTLDNVYTEESEMKSEDDPFKKVPAMDEHDKPSTLLEMEKSMDAVVEYTSEQRAATSLEADNELSSLDHGSRGLSNSTGGKDLLKADNPTNRPVDIADGLKES